MAIVATTTNPSTTNLQGGIAGLITTAAMGFLAQTGYITIAATAIGVPEATLAVLAAGIIGVVAKVAVTHIAELREADNFIKALPQANSAPTDFPNPAPQDTGSATPNNINKP